MSWGIGYFSPIGGHEQYSDGELAGIFKRGTWEEPTPELPDEPPANIVRLVDYINHHSDMGADFGDELGYGRADSGEPEGTEGSEDDGKIIEVSDFPIEPAPLVYFGIPYSAGEETMVILGELIDKYDVVLVDDGLNVHRPTGEPAV